MVVNSPMLEAAFDETTLSCIINQLSHASSCIVPDITQSPNNNLYDTLREVNPIAMVRENLFRNSLAMVVISLSTSQFKNIYNKAISNFIK